MHHVNRILVTRIVTRGEIVDLVVQVLSHLAPRDGIERAGKPVIKIALCVLAVALVGVLGTAGIGIQVVLERIGEGGHPRACARFSARSSPLATLPRVVWAKRLAWSGVILPKRPSTTCYFSAFLPPSPAR